jgi:hypothetical protein
MRWIVVNIIYFGRWAATYDLNRYEFAFSLVGLVLLLAGLRLRWTGAVFSVLCRTPFYGIASIGLLALILRAALLPVLPVPEPLVTDEFSHLLLADTLASGRLANPVHPMWCHFETIHVIQKPVYASMYFPAQGAFLAAGKLIFGHPFWGVWLSNGLMCAALTWMLFGWLPPGWALFGGLIAVLRLSVFSYWNDSYWGGALPALAGALVLGAIPRIRIRPAAGHGVIFGLGALLLLFSRPYEGFVLCAVASLFCFRQVFTRAALAVTLMLCIGGAGMAYYCYRVTGSPLTLPYQVNQKAYGWPMTLLWYQPHAVSTPHKELREYYEWEFSEHEKFWPDSTVIKAQFLWGFFIGPCLTVPLLFFGGIVRDRRIRPLLVIAACVLGAVLVEQTGYPHYLAPATGAILAIVVQGVRHLRQTTYGFGFTAMIPIILVVTLAVRPFAEYKSLAHILSWCCQEKVRMDRGAMQAKLEALPGQHLVIVHYGKDHSFAREWVYNPADIDAAKVVWARDMGPANEELKAYFAGRQIWEIEPVDK